MMKLTAIGPVKKPTKALLDSKIPKDRGEIPKANAWLLKRGTNRPKVTKS